MITHEPTPKRRACMQWLDTLHQGKVHHRRVDEQYEGESESCSREEFGPAVEGNATQSIQYGKRNGCEIKPIHLPSLKSAQEYHEHAHHHIVCDKNFGHATSLEFERADHLVVDRDSDSAMRWQAVTLEMRVEI